MEAKAGYVFELSWEVCNKVGGIYTVIQSKASIMMSIYKNYFLIGPYFEHNAKSDFVGMDLPPEFKNAFDALRNEGIICYFGKWLETNSYCILIDFSRIAWQKNDLKLKIWEDYKIDSLRAGWDFEEPLLWGNAAARLIEKISNDNPSINIVTHCHEWLAGFASLYLKKHCPRIATVFTTHATVLGRSLSSKGIDLYQIMDNIDVTRSSYDNNVEAKHMAEMNAVLNADIFTTVSEVTALEAEKFLGRKPDVITHNGLDIDKFPSFDDLSIKHISSRNKIREFLIYYFFPYYNIDINNSLIFYTVGRYEYRNKGYDLMIKALGKLNQTMKQTPNSRNVVAFFWIPMANAGLRLDVLENKNYYMHIKNYVDSNGEEILRRMVYDFISKKENVNDLLADDFMKEIKKNLAHFERTGDPPLSTHNINEYGNDIFSAIRQQGLLNRKEDMVKVILEPVYLDGTDGFIDLEYYDAMVGCHLGIFPSYYEPYGYTPLESAALGVPSITTDMSGFGRFIKTKNPENKGIIVLDRFHKSEDQVINDLSQMLYDFSHQPHSIRLNCKLKAKSLSAFADWKILCEDYVKAHNLALEKAQIRR